MLVRIIVVLSLSLALAGCGDTAGPPLDGVQERTRMTPRTTRIPAEDPEGQAIALTQIVYPSTRDDNRPGAVILATQDPVAAFAAMHRVTHMPSTRRSSIWPKTARYRIGHSRS